MTGVWSLQLVFGGQSNVDYRQVFQEAVVTPGKWQLQGFVRTSGITTDQGIYLRIYDAAQPQRLDIRTDALTERMNGQNYSERLKSDRKLRSCELRSAGKHQRNSTTR